LKSAKGKKLNCYNFNLVGKRKNFIEVRRDTRTTDHKTKGGPRQHERQQHVATTAAAATATAATSVTATATPTAATCACCHLCNSHTHAYMRAKFFFNKIKFNAAKMLGAWHSFGSIFFFFLNFFVFFLLQIAWQTPSTRMTTPATANANELQMQCTCIKNENG